MACFLKWGNRLTLYDGTTLTSYTYSSANRLELADAGGTVTTYGYDAAGNRTSQQSPTDGRANGTSALFARGQVNGTGALLAREAKKSAPVPLDGSGGQKKRTCPA